MGGAVARGSRAQWSRRSEAAQLRTSSISCPAMCSGCHRHRLRWRGSVRGRGPGMAGPCSRHVGRQRTANGSLHKCALAPLRRCIQGALASMHTRRLHSAGAVIPRDGQRQRDARLRAPAGSVQPAPAACAFRSCYNAGTFRFCMSGAFMGCLPWLARLRSRHSRPLQKSKPTGATNTLWASGVVST